MEYRIAVKKLKVDVCEALFASVTLLHETIATTVKLIASKCMYFSEDLAQQEDISTHQKII
jgi:hypothetical protein